MPRDKHTESHTWCVVVGHSRDGLLQVDVPDEGVVKVSVDFLSRRRQAPGARLIRHPDLQQTQPIPLPSAVKVENAEDYMSLCTWYLEPYTEADAPALDGTSGAVLRHPRQRPPRLHSHCAGYKVLREKIGSLKRAGDHVTIYNLLLQLRTFEQKLVMRGLGLPLALQAPGGVPEIVDLTKDKKKVVELDAFIAGMLNPRKGSDASASGWAPERSASPVVFIKTEAPTTADCASTVGRVISLRTERLDSLPPEVLANVLRKLCAADIAQLLIANPSFSKVPGSSSVFREAVKRLWDELAATGLADAILELPPPFHQETQLHRLARLTGRRLVTRQFCNVVLHLDCIPAGFGDCYNMLSSLSTGVELAALEKLYAILGQWSALSADEADAKNGEIAMQNVYRLLRITCAAANNSEAILDLGSRMRMLRACWSRSCARRSCYLSTTFKRACAG